MTAEALAPAVTGTVQFPIIESFTNGHPTNPHWELKGSAQLNGSLELTPDQKSKSGTALLNQPFSSALGVTIDFDFAVEGASTPPSAWATASASTSSTDSRRLSPAPTVPDSATP